MAQVLYEYWGKRGVFYVGGKFYAAGIPVDVDDFEPEAHPFGQTNNQPNPGPSYEAQVVGGGAEIEQARSRVKYVAVVLRYQLYPFTSSNWLRWCGEGRFRHRNYPNTADFIVKGRKEQWQYSKHWSDDFTYGFGYLPVKITV